MERFLEIILEVEKEAVELEESAAQSLSEIEQEYCLALAKLEAASLKQVYDELDTQKETMQTELKNLQEQIKKINEEKCSLLQKSGVRISKTAAKLVIENLLPTKIGK